MNIKIAITKSLLVTGCTIGAILSINGGTAYAHGYVESPPSRGYQGQLDTTSLGWDKANQLYGAVITNPQGLENPKGFPQSGPSDGSIASASGVLGDNILDIQNSNRWKKTTVNTGPNSFTWHYTAAHKTSKWHYYMTKQVWDQNAPLSRDSLELIGEVKHDGSLSTNNLTHTINIPEEKTGYHVILAVWDVEDTTNAFYNVIDVNVDDNSLIPAYPEKPNNVQTKNVTNSSVLLTWESQAVVEKYNVYQNNKKIATVNSNNYEVNNLKANTKYKYKIEAVSFSGLVSEKSDPVEVNTLSTEDVQKPATPEGLHSMEVTESDIYLMWNPSTHLSGIKNYQVYRDGELIDEISTINYKDSGLKANTSYTHTIKAVSNTGVISEVSQPLNITTKGSSAPSEEGAREWKVGTFTSPEIYAAGEIVSYKGNNYSVLQSHSNYGDESWSPEQALSLFSKIN
ncbi:TPA: lytic polysaccharide monooxygenase [Enterococcus faecium]